MFWSSKRPSSIFRNIIILLSTSFGVSNFSCVRIFIRNTNEGIITLLKVASFIDYIRETKVNKSIAFLLHSSSSITSSPQIFCQLPTLSSKIQYHKDYRNLLYQRTIIPSLHVKTNVHRTILQIPFFEKDARRFVQSKLGNRIEISWEKYYNSLKNIIVQTHGLINSIFVVWFLIDLYKRT